MDPKDLPFPPLPHLPGLSGNSVRLELEVIDPESVDALASLPEGRARNDFARQALRIGIIALRQAQGRVDAETVRHEGERLMMALGNTLGDYRRQTESLLHDTLKAYFDPSDGRFTERVERLVRQDGELERVMRGQMENNQRAIAEVLTEFVGEDSALLRLLTPDESNQFLAGLRQSLEATLSGQSGQILREFSLDNPDSALTRLVRELKERHGELTGDLAKQIEGVVNEFSLDNDHSALSRLVRRVEHAQKQISNEFSLDAENSALARMKRELLGVLDAQQARNEAFQAQVQEALSNMRVRKEEAARSTAHGRSFQEEGFTLIQRLCEHANDIAENVGDSVGLIPRSKVGDCVITLGADCAAAGARVVVEFKEDASYNLTRTLEEIETARKNREAGIGIFVHSRRTAPQGMSEFARHGNDIVLVWDAEDERSDLLLRAGLMVAKCICVRAGAQAQGRSVELTGMESAMRAIEKHCDKFETIRTRCNSIRAATDVIVQQADIGQREILRQIAELDEHLTGLKKVGVR
ncbi:MAG TPA: hypothetical protein VFB54_04165 [Burkholderiales bacterium]|nr:hypothetical protein [Burkholderiales bacterium]